MKTKDLLVTLCACLAALSLSPRTFADEAAAGSASLSNSLAQIRSDSQSAGDSQLKSLGADLNTKAEALNKALGANTAAAGGLQGALAALSGTNSAGALATLQKLNEAKLTPEQVKLAKDFRNVGAAYLVRKNFASLDGSQSDVAQIVTSLRNGQAVAAVPSIKKVSENARLSDAQKTFLNNLAEAYAPGAGKVKDTLKALKSLPGF